MSIIAPIVVPRPPEWLAAFFGRFLYDEEVMDSLFAVHPENRRRFLALLRMVTASDPELACFAGAGVSQPYGVPTWYRFLEAAADRLGKGEAIAPLLEAGEFEDAAQLLEDHSPGGFEAVIRDTFRQSNIAHELKGAGAYLPFLPFRCVVTTNFDYVLDEIFQLCGVDLRPVIYGASASFARAAAGDGLHPLLKIHGDYLHDRIFTRRQYDARYAGEGRLRGELAELFSAFDFLFVGFSLKDRNVQQALAQAHAADRRAHFAILPAEDGATLAQRDAELAALGVSAIWYEGDHAQIENLLGFLANAALPGDLLLRLGAAFRNNAPAFAADAAEALMEARPFCHPYRLAFAWSEIDAGFAGLPAPPDQVDGLIARIDRAIGVAGDFGDAYAVRGMMNHARFNFAEAAADMTRALEMATSERQAELFCLRGIMRYAQSDLEGARVDWEAAIADWDQLGERKLAAGYRVMLAMATSQLGDAEATANVLRELDLNDIEDSGDRRNARFMRLILLSQVPFQRLARRLGIGPPKRRFTKKILRLMIAALRSGIIRP